MLTRIQARRLHDAVLENFLVSRSPVAFLEDAPPKTGDRDTCYLFSYFAAAGMLYRAIRAGEADMRPLYRHLIDGFAYYRDGRMPAGQSKYHSERGNEPNGGHGECFFDDNIWVARNLLCAYEVLQEPDYLAEAKRIVAYTYTAWDPVLGGLVWCEKGLTDQGTEQELERGLSANACCILVNAWLYRITGEKAYLDWALRFYAFCKQMQDPQTKIYYNGVHTLLRDGKRTAGAVNHDLYSYNPGSIILADLLLHEITGDAAYEQDAWQTARATHKAFLRQNENGTREYRDFIWFTAIWAEAAAELAKREQAPTRAWRDVFEGMLSYGIDHFERYGGLIPHDSARGWRPGMDDYDRLLLTHSANAEIAWLLVSGWQE